METRDRVADGKRARGQFICPPPHRNKVKEQQTFARLKCVWKNDGDRYETRASRSLALSHTCSGVFFLEKKLRERTSADLLPAAVTFMPLLKRLFACRHNSRPRNEVIHHDRRRNCWRRCVQ